MYAVRRRAAGTNGGAGAGGKSSVRRAREREGTRRKRSWKSGRRREPGAVYEGARARHSGGRRDPGEGRGAEGGGGGA